MRMVREKFLSHNATDADRFFPDLIRRVCPAAVKTKTIYGKTERCAAPVVPFMAKPCCERSEPASAAGAASEGVGSEILTKIGCKRASGRVFV